LFAAVAGLTEHKSAKVAPLAASVRNRFICILLEDVAAQPSGDVGVGAPEDVLGAKFVRSLLKLADGTVRLERSARLGDTGQQHPRSRKQWCPACLASVNQLKISR
jgi:hypothetical protein